MVQGTATVTRGVGYPSKVIFEDRQLQVGVLEQGCVSVCVMDNPHRCFLTKIISSF